MTTRIPDPESLAGGTRAKRPAGLAGGRVLAWLLAATALWLGMLMQRQGSDALVLVPAIVLAAWCGGLWGGLVMTVLACAAAYFSVTPMSTNTMSALALSGLMISALGAALRRARAGGLSAREDAASQLRDTETSLARAQRIAHLGSWELDITSGQLAWSDETFRIFGLVPGSEPVTYERFMAHVHPDDRDYVDHSRDLALRGGPPLNIEHRIVRADHEVRWVQEVREWYTDALGQGNKVTGIVLDITERKQAQLQLLEAKQTLEQTVVERTAQLQAALVQAEAADRAKSAFLATMSHELRTPLNSILGFTGILLQSLAGPLNAEQSKQLGMVRGSARHLLELINDVLDISRIEARQLPIRPEPFDLVPVLERVVASLGPQAKAKGLSLASELPAGAIELVGDRRRVEQVLINLVGNAIKFTEHGGVTLTVEVPGQPESPPAAGPARQVRIHVADTGIGIGPDDLEKLFRPFFQVDTGLSRTHEGTGLGLAICSRLVQLMGGSLSVDSTPGVGSTFILTLPESGAPNQ